MMRQLSQDALDRLAEVKKHILEEPARFRMDLWTSDDQGPACKTTGCIAGWVLALDKMKRLKVSASAAVHFLRNPEESAGDLLDLTYRERKALFYTHGWTHQYSDSYNDIGDMTIHPNHNGPTNSGIFVFSSEDILKARANNARVFAKLIDKVIKERSIWWIQS